MSELPLSREQIISRLYSAVLSDVLDSLGYMRQAMRPFVRPLDDAMILFGRVRTGLYAETYHVRADGNPYELEIELVDDLKSGEVILLACGGPTERVAPWGELLTTASVQRGAAGCVTDGLVRDIHRIRRMGFPVFHGGVGPLDTKGRAEMIARDVPVECGGVRVETGDWVFGDIDGIVVVPGAAAVETFSVAMQKVNAEDVTRKELQAGRSLREVYERYGVL